MKTDRIDRVRHVASSPSAWVNGVLLSLVLWMAFKRLRRAYPPMEATLNSDAYWTYLPNARKLLSAPWTFLSTDPRSYDVAPLTYIWAAALGADQATIQTANGALFLIGLVLFWAFVRRLGGTLAAFISAALIVAHPDIADHAPLVLTEAPYFFGLTLTMYSALRAYTSTESPKLWHALLVVALDITLLVRPILQYLLLLSIVALTVWLIVGRARLDTERRRVRMFLIALLCSLVLPTLVVVKNGVYFGVWGIGTGSGTGLYYGVNPFKNGAEPVYSNFSYDAGAAPYAVDSSTGGHPLDKRSDAINRAVALELIKQTQPIDNLRFFWLKIRGWLVTSTPELAISPKLRLFRVFEWLCVGLFACMFLAKSATRRPISLPGDFTTMRQKLTVYSLLLITVVLMAVQLAPILYNTRYASYAIEPWLIALTGLSLAYWIQSGPSPNGGKLYFVMTLRILVVLALVYLAQSITAHALRREVWRIDPYRPGPTALVLPSSQFSRPQATGMNLKTDETWEVTTEPATLEIQVDTSLHTMKPQELREAMWRLRFALAAPSDDRPSRCGKIAFAVEPHQEELNFYTPPAIIYAEPTSKATTYMLSANGTWRPRGNMARFSLTFHCPAGTRVTWQGMEMRRSTLAEAARDFMLHGVPINPYLHTEP